MREKVVQKLLQNGCTNIIFHPTLTRSPHARALWVELLKPT